MGHGVVLNASCVAGNGSCTVEERAEPAPFLVFAGCVPSLLGRGSTNCWWSCDTWVLEDCAAGAYTCVIYVLILVLKDSKLVCNIHSYQKHQSCIG